MQHFGTLQQPLLGELAGEKREIIERKMPFIVATYVSACSPRSGHILHMDQKHVLYLNRDGSPYLSSVPVDSIMFADVLENLSPEDNVKVLIKCIILLKLTRNRI